MISAPATNPKLTDESGGNVFRVCGRDDDQGPMGAYYLDEHWGEDKIAILHDGEAFGRGLAEQAKAYLNRMGVQKALLEAYTPGEDDYSDLVAAMKAAEIDVAYVGGVQADIGLIARQARDRGQELQIVGGDSLQAPEFADTAGVAAEGVLFTAARDPSGEPEAAEVMSALRGQGLDDPIIAALYNYAAIQTWAQAVEAAGVFDLGEVSKVLHDQTFETVIGKVEFDDKGDVTEAGFEWFVWTKGGPVSKS
jgi:branched-chain amino acid transport system substrate-binding protein